MNAALPLSSLPAAMRDEQHFPVVIVGAGPTGLMLANLLGLQGIKTLVVERNTDTVGEPRAVTIDDESLRTVQAAGLLDEVLPQVVQGYGVHYHSWRGKEFARIEPKSQEYGFPKRNAFRQQLLVGELRDGLQRFDHTAIWFGHELTGFRDEGEAGGGETVHLALSHDGQTRHITCQWLVASDGGRSKVREQLGIALKGSTYDEKWLIVDLLDRVSAFRHTSTYCDPVRPAIRLPGPQGTLRYEFMLHEGEDAEQVLDEGNVRGWIRARNPADAQLAITRKVVYAFHARVAERWQSGRVFLAGDAAHLTPPFAGQGMNSGVRDAANLAWKLAAVVRGEMAPSLLATYAQERKPHAWSLIEMAVRIGRFMQPKSVLAAMLAQGALRLCSLYPPARDYVLQLKFKPRPRFGEGFFLRGERPEALVPAGQLLPQPRVELPGGSQVPLDDVLGHGFAWLGLADATPPTDLRLPCRMVRVVAQRDDFLRPEPGIDAALRDIDGSLESILRSAGARAVLLRPDRYVLAYLGYGGARDEPDLHQWHAGFAAQPSTAC
ncbi:3-(3-hydroxyphenyl)propionate hydroxylase [Rhodoferax koreense]|uniref:3-(3-hydroxyphenyl)propionate hydroxylase n=1 Tax=Rhodoferax koreensis TaxID=1842727 RepID=A0A1P8K0T4_9BURK|nr:bifunctional 3-(3-hydroxy-phenyl)propionate/3-hydroxycinnamic acid hydroxylase [Rhodoferax koreense]APW39607.1 3-(3-hydroxyphenyl)propionate hydroxylase [Rhodoferax koreense]